MEKPTILGLQKELKEFQATTDEKINLILNAVTKGEKPKVEVEPEEAKPQEDIPVLSPATKTLFNKYFDEADGFRAQENHPERNRVTIYVPKDISNASEAHFAFYADDERSSKIITENYELEVEKFFKAVAKQLRYDRNAQRK